MPLGPDDERGRALEEDRRPGELCREPGVPNRTDLYTEWPIALKFEGDFNSVFAFLRRTEEMSRLTQVKSMKVKLF